MSLVRKKGRHDVRLLLTFNSSAWCCFGRWDDIGGPRGTEKRIHYFFRQIFEPAQNGNKCGRDRHRVGGALRCDFLLAEKGSECKR
jgi:hypothetical protein